MHGKARAENNFMLSESIRCMYAGRREGGGGGGGGGGGRGGVAFSSLLH